MKVVHFAEYASGGVATYIKNLVDSQIKNVSISEIIIFCSKSNSDLGTLKFQSEKVKIIPYSYKRGIRGIFKILNMKKAIMANQPDVIHIHSTFAGLVRFSFMFSRSKNKILYCAHGWSFDKETSKINLFLYKLVEKFLANFCYKIINISNHDNRSANFINSSKMITIRNSIPDLNIKAVHILAKNKNRRILFVGRLDFQKGVDILLNVVNKYFQRKNIQLIVVGESLLENEKNIEQKNTESIKFVGKKSQSEVFNLLSETDALIMPSRWEGFGLTALEAMREAKMVISSNAGALPELIINNYNGLLFDKDSEQSLYKALNAFLLMSDKNILEFGVRGRHKYLTDFNYNKMLNDFNKLYLEVTEN